MREFRAAAGLEAKQVTVKVRKSFSVETEQVWAVVHTASGRSMSSRYGKTKEEAEAMIAAIYRTIPEADWTKPVADLVKIPNLQVRILEAM